MFNSIILKINILSFLTGIRHTDVRGISGGNPSCPPPVTCGDGPGGACGSASLRRHLHCFGSLPETSLTLRCGPEGPSHLNPQSLRDSPLLRGATPFPLEFPVVFQTVCQNHKKSVPGVISVRDAVLKAAATYSPTWWGSTIGASGLNFSVRYG